MDRLKQAQERLRITDLEEALTEAHIFSVKNPELTEYEHWVSCLQKSDEQLASMKQLMKLMIAIHLEKCTQQNLNKMKFALFQIKENNLYKFASSSQKSKITE